MGFGEGSASIDELLAGSSGRPSQDGATPAAEDGDTRPVLLRQTTAVGDTTITTIPNGVATPDIITEDSSELHSTSAALPILGSATSSLRNATTPNIQSLTQTPMNDYFLSSLANNHSGLATPSRDDASSGPGSRRSHEVLEEEPAAEAAAEAADANSSDSDGMQMDP